MSKDQHIMHSTGVQADWRCAFELAAAAAMAIDHKELAGVPVSEAELLAARRLWDSAQPSRRPVPSSLH